MNQLNSDTRSGSSNKRSRTDSSEEGAEGGPVSYRDENRENDEAVVNRVIQSKSEDKGGEEDTYRQEMPSSSEPEQQGAEAQQQQQPQPKKQKVKTHITAKDYENMTHLLAHHLKVAESKAEAAEAEGGAAAGSAGFVGVLWEDLVAQYVDQVRESFVY